MENEIKVETLLVVKESYETNINEYVIVYDVNEQKEFLIILSFYLSKKIFHTDFIVGKCVGWKVTQDEMYCIIHCLSSDNLYYQKVFTIPRITSEKYIVIQDRDFLLFVTRYNKTIPIFSKLQLQHYYISENSGYLLADLSKLRYYELLSYFRYVNKYSLTECDINVIKDILLSGNFDYAFTRSTDTLLEPLQKDEFIVNTYDEDLIFWNKDLILNFPQRDLKRKIDLFNVLIRAKSGESINDEKLKEKIYCLNQKLVECVKNIPNSSSNIQLYYDVILKSVKDKILTVKLEKISNYLIKNDLSSKEISQIIDPIITHIFKSNSQLQIPIKPLLDYLKVVPTQNFLKDLQENKLSRDFIQSFLINQPAKEVIKHLNFFEIFSAGIYRILTNDILPVEATVCNNKLFLIREGLLLHTKEVIKGKMKFQGGTVVGYGTFGNIKLECNCVTSDNEDCIQLLSNEQVLLSKSLYQLYSRRINNSMVTFKDDKVFVNIKNNTEFIVTLTKDKAIKFSELKQIEENLSKIMFKWLC